MVVVHPMEECAFRIFDGNGNFLKDTSAVANEKLARKIQRLLNKE